MSSILTILGPAEAANMLNDIRVASLAYVQVLEQFASSPPNEGHGPLGEAIAQLENAIKHLKDKLTAAAALAALGPCPVHGENCPHRKGKAGDLDIDPDQLS